MMFDIANNGNMVRGGYTECGDLGKQARWQPYSDNGGTIAAIAGDNFAIIAADCRLSSGYSILTRDQKKLFKLTDNTVLGSSGCWCDTLSLSRLLRARLQMYLHEHHKQVSTPALAQMLSTVLYHKRFFPYYVSNVIAGLDQNGKGCVYSYDPIGHTARSTHQAAGSAGSLLQPLLDNQIGGGNMAEPPQTPLTLERAVIVLKDAFTSAAERDIHTGDSVFINIITRDGVKEEIFQLRKD